MGVQFKDYFTCRGVILTARSMLSQLLASEEKGEEAADPDAAGPGDPARVGQAPPQGWKGSWPGEARGGRGTAVAAGYAGAAAGGDSSSASLSWEADELLWKGDFNALGLESTDDDEELEAELLQRLAAANAGSQRVREEWHT